MERLKSVLRKTIGAKAQVVRIRVGSQPEVAVNGNITSLADEPPLSQSEVNGLFGFLFPNDTAALQAKKLTKGTLNVPGLGKILLIAQPENPGTIRFYMPSGEANFQNDWQRLNQKTVAPGPAPSKPSPSAQPAVQQPAVQQAPKAPAPIPMPSGLASVADPGPSSIPNIMADSPADNIPSMAESQPIEYAPSNIDPIPVAVEGLPPVHAEEDSDAPDIEAVEPPGPLQVDLPTHQDYAVVAESTIQYSDEISPMGGPAPVAYSAPRDTIESAEINFGIDKESGGVTSNGQNAIDNILKDMIEKGASDLHLTMGQPICMRIDGSIARLDSPPLDEQTMSQYLLPIIPKRNKIEFATENDTDFAYEIADVGRFRINVFRDRIGVGIVMRHIPSEILTADQLNLTPAVRTLCKLHKGLVVVTGPTGSGKSTTLAAMVDLINKSRDEHILTIEDPIEFVHPQYKCLVNQREIAKHTISFSRALRAALREDPDIVLIGEMRDLETVAIAIETAETGHLVFGTLHTNTAVSTIDRIIDQFPAEQQEQIRVMLAASLKGVICQTLLKKKGGGRVAAQEILILNDAVAAMIREGKNHMVPNHMMTQRKEGNQILSQSLAQLVRDGVVEAEEAYNKAIDKTSFVHSLQRMGIKMDLSLTNEKKANEAA